MPKILVDADACPVIDIIIQVASQFNLEVLLICDTSHSIQRKGAKTVIVSKGADAVDFVLVNLVQKKDIIVTQDYALAAMVLAKKGYVIDQNGRLYTAENIDQLLLSRYISQKIRRAGGRTKGSKKRKEEADKIFAENFTTLCEKIAKED